MMSRKKLSSSEIALIHTFQGACSDDPISDGCGKGVAKLSIGVLFSGLTARNIEAYFLGYSLRWSVIIASGSSPRLSFRERIR